MISVAEVVVYRQSQLSLVGQNPVARHDLPSSLAGSLWF